MDKEDEINFNSNILGTFENNFFGDIKNDELFYLEIEKLKHFPEHKFELYSGERFDDMVKSIEDYGIISPVIVWEEDNDYIILSGHNRVEAAKKIGLEKVPCLIRRNLTIEEATLIVLETNLIQRSFSDLSYSERAYVLAQYYNTVRISRGRKKNWSRKLDGIDDTTDSLVGLDKISNEYNLSKDTIKRYIKIASLIEPLLKKIDSDHIKFITAYNLSFIDDTKIQYYLNDLLEKGEKISLKKSEELKKAYLENNLNINNINEYFSKKNNISNNNSSEYIKIKLNNSIFSKYFKKDFDDKNVEEIIYKAIEFYFENNKNNIM